MSSLTRPGPSSTSTRTASVSHSPAPAASVSARCRSVESGSADSTAATPPWAHRVVVWCSSPLVSTPTRSPWMSAARTAADNPATPLPSTSRSRASAPSGGSVIEGSGPLGHGLVQGDRAVAGIDVDDGRLVVDELLVGVVGVGDHDHLVTGLHESGRGPVEADLARTAGDGVGLEPGAVVDVEHVDLLVLADVGSGHQVDVQGDRADVVQVGVGHRRPVDLRLHHASAHAV